MQSVIADVKWRGLLPGQRTRIHIVDIESLVDTVVWESTDALVEAANWSPEGSTLVVNSGGCLLRLAVDGGTLLPIDTGDVVDVNNDHLIARDGRSIYVSSEGTGHLYEVDFRGGSPRQISPERAGIFSCFLQGLSPDGKTLSFAGATLGSTGEFLTSLYSIGVDGSNERRHSAWPKSTVGFEFGPESQWWYFNSDAWDPSGAQIYRMHPDGSQREQLTFGPRVNWFPKLSPDGERVVFLSFAPGTVGHEANVDAEIWLMRPDGADQTRVVSLFGGQGTLNVNSWAPDSRRFAYIDYPIHVAGDSSDDRGVLPLVST